MAIVIYVLLSAHALNRMVLITGICEYSWIGEFEMRCLLNLLSNLLPLEIILGFRRWVGVVVVVKGYLA